LNQSFDRHHIEETDGKPRERAIAVTLKRDGQTEEIVWEHLDELILLADTAGADVVDQIVQSRRAPDPATWMGRGKVEQITAAADELNVDLILVDDDLSPAQAKNLSRQTQRRVLDRSGLILDIFAKRARTREARTQVELAQLNYLLPRLSGAWTHLERQRGGIGLRGPGETQLETDRRLVRTRIRHLKQELEKIQRQRTTRRGRRDELFRVALVGYTNAGKSTLLNRLTGAEVYCENRLFATLDSTVRRLEMHDGTTALLADTVGFIRKLPHHLVASFRSTLEEAAEADLLLHIIDLSHPGYESHIEAVNGVLYDLGAGGTPILHIFNKVDLVDDPTILRGAENRYSPCLMVSATEALHLDDLVDRVIKSRAEGLIEFKLLVPWKHFAMCTDIRLRATIHAEDSLEDGALLSGRVPRDGGQSLIDRWISLGCELHKSTDE
jgi:GTPase